MVANPKITGPSLVAQPVRETQIADIQIIVIERLAQLEQRLKTVTDSQPKTKKASVKRQSEIQQLTHSVDNLKAYLTLSQGAKVTNGIQLGVITDLTLSPGGMPEVWVSWYAHVPIPEQPKRLKSEPFFEHLKVGDSITINDQHPEAAQKSFEIKEFRGDGWILTKNNQLFHHDFIELTSLISSESEPDLSTQDEEVTMSEMLAENLKEIVEETVTETPEMSETVEPTEHKPSTTTTVEVVETHQLSTLLDTDELTYSEQRDRLFLERKVERAFYEAGKALQEIRDRRLYRSTHQTFEQYCADRFAFKRRHPYQLMNAAEVFDNLLNSDLSSMCANGAQMSMRTNGAQTEAQINMSTIGAQNDDGEMCPNGAQNSEPKMSTNGAQILPTSERQVRPLTNLEPDQQREAWHKAVEQAGGKVPSGSIVKSIVDQIRERTKVPNPWRVGEVATIIVKENPDLRGKGGCWAVISEVHNFSCTVRLWDAEYLVKPEHLKSLPYTMTDKDQNFFRELCDRLSKISLDDVEKPVRDFLAGLGKIDRPYLTELEERILRMLEPSL